MSGKSKTIAVLGSGVDNPLPKQNLHLSNKILENVKNRYIQFGKDEGKIYDENLNGIEIATFEWMDDSIVSDSQIKNGINKITKEKFNIKSSVKRVSGMNMYKVIVIE